MRLFFRALLILFIVGCTERQKAQTNSEILHSPRADTTHTKQEADNFNRQASSIGQMLYVPVYSHIYQQDRQKTFNLTTTLSIRNADPYRSFTLTQVSYYDSKGQLVQHFLNSDRNIKPLASTSFVIEERDLRGGVGANFIVRWKSQDPIIPPVVEAVNISTTQQQGISFLSTGRVLQERTANQTENN